MPRLPSSSRTCRPAAVSTRHAHAPARPSRIFLPVLQQGPLLLALLPRSAQAAASVPGALTPPRGEHGVPLTHRLTSPKHLLRLPPARRVAGRPAVQRHGHPQAWPVHPGRAGGALRGRGRLRGREARRAHDLHPAVQGARRARRRCFAPRPCLRGRCCTAREAGATRLSLRPLQIPNSACLRARPAAAPPPTRCSRRPT